jgi:hypothetical protein
MPADVARDENAVCIGARSAHDLFRQFDSLFHAISVSIFLEVMALSPTTRQSRKEEELSLAKQSQ